MNKLLIGILSFIYITVASGIAVNIHYCMGKMTGVAYVYDKDHGDNCTKCGMENKTGCCHSDFKMVKLADDQQVSKSFTAFLSSPIALQPSFVDLSQSIQGAAKPAIFSYYPPPDNRLSEVYLHTCVFRI